MDKMDLAANGDIIPKSDPNKVMLKTQSGDELVISNLQKTLNTKVEKTLMLVTLVRRHWVQVFMQYLHSFLKILQRKTFLMP